MTNSPLAHEIHAAIREAAGGGGPLPDRKFNKAGEFISYPLKTDEWRRIMRGFRPRIAALSLDERLALAEELLGTRIGLLGHSGIYVLALSTGDIGPQHYPLLDGIADDFTGWSHVDDFCIEVLQPLLRADRAQTLRLLDEWNRSPNRWKRRASVVAFVRKVGQSGQFTEEALRICENLVWDPEDLVQKGVGWALKDVMRGSPERVLEYVKDLRRRGVPATITLYAIRDLRGPEREAMLAVRSGLA